MTVLLPPNPVETALKHEYTRVSKDLTPTVCISHRITQESSAGPGMRLCASVVICVLPEHLWVPLSAVLSYRGRTDSQCSFNWLVIEHFFHVYWPFLFLCFQTVHFINQATALFDFIV